MVKDLVEDFGGEGVYAGSHGKKKRSCTNWEVKVGIKG
jgi:hypothetical protein